MSRIEELAQRLEAGERYIAANGPSEKASRQYAKLEGKYVALCCQAERERDITAITLNLPPEVHWQRTATAAICEQVRVIYHGEPEADNELSREDLWALLRTCDDAKAASIRRNNDGRRMM